MIDPDTFAAEWAELDAHFPGERADSEARRYYRYLNERMDTDAFLQASARLYAEREHFPRPLDFVNAITPPEGAALEQWELCQQIMQDSRRAPEILETMDAEGQRVVRAMGGIRQLTKTKLDEVTWKRKTFLRLYGTASEVAAHDQIPPMTDDGKKLVEDAMAGRLEGS